MRTRAELVDIRAYIARFDPAAADRLADRIAAVAASLDQFAERGSPVADGIRQLSIVYPYGIRYRVRIDEVRILRIRHGARPPLGPKP